MHPSPQIVGKSAFAAQRNVSPGRVTQWISEGKIGPEALSGEGRSAKIIVAVANEHLRQRLDPSQRFGINGLTTRLDDGSPVAPSATPVALPAPPPIVDTFESQLKAEKLRQAQLSTRRSEEQDRLLRGVYILARDVADQNKRIAAKLVESFEGALADFASALAAKHEIPARDVLHLLRAEFRKVRGRMAADFAAAAAAEPEIVADAETHDIPAAAD